MIAVVITVVVVALCGIGSFWVGNTVLSDCEEECTDLSDGHVTQALRRFQN